VANTMLKSTSASTTLLFQPALSVTAFIDDPFPAFRYISVNLVLPRQYSITHSQTDLGLDICGDRPILTKGPSHRLHRRHHPAPGDTSLAPCRIQIMLDLTQHLDHLAGERMIRGARKGQMLVYSSFRIHTLQEHLAGRRNGIL